MYKDETFELFQCDYMVLQPFQIIIDENQYKELLVYLESTEKTITQSELITLAKKLNLNYKKSRVTKKKAYLKVIPLSCEYCYKYTICPKYSTSTTRTEREKIAILNTSCNNQRQRKILNLLNFNKPAGYYFSSKEITEPIKTEIKENNLKEVEKWKNFRQQREEETDSLNLEYKLRKKSTIIGGERGATKWDF